MPTLLKSDATQRWFARPWGGLLGHEVAVAVLTVAPANDLVHVLARVLGEQRLVGAHTAGGEDDGLGIKLYHVVVLVDVLDAGHGVGSGQMRAKARALVRMSTPSSWAMGVRVLMAEVPLPPS